MNKYQAQYRIVAIIGVDVYGDSIEAAVEAARDRIKDSFWAKSVEYLDGHKDLIGVSDGWELPE